MNDGVTVCINVLRSVFDHLNTSSSLSLLETDELIERISTYGSAVGGYFARMSEDERLAFRRLRGVEGQTTGTRMCQAAVKEEMPRFAPDGLDDWLERRKANTNEQARIVIDRIETTLQDKILQILKAEYDDDETQWWFEGIPINVRKKVDDRINEAGGGQREETFDFIHYEAIIRHQWAILKDLFAYGEAGGSIGKQSGTAWLRDISEMRNKVMHPSRRDFLSFDQLSRLQHYEQWLLKRLAQE